MIIWRTTFRYFLTAGLLFLWGLWLIVSSLDHLQQTSNLSPVLCSLPVTQAPYAKGIKSFSGIWALDPHLLTITNWGDGDEPFLQSLQCFWWRHLHSAFGGWVPGLNPGMINDPQCSSKLGCCDVISFTLVQVRCRWEYLHWEFDWEERLLE